MKYQFIITGRRWFQRTYGNTYHTASIEVRTMEGETVYTEKSPKQYGYGNQWEWTATDMLEKAGFMPIRVHHENGGTEPLWAYCERVGYPRPIVNCSDVSRERDL